MKAVVYASLLALGLCAAAAAPAHAQFAVAGPPGSTSLFAPVSGYTYFNRPGATLEQQRADLEACDATVMAMEQPFQTSGAGAAYGLVGVLVDVSIAGAQQQMAQRRSRFPLYENCMVLRGWRVVRVSDELGARLDVTEQPDLAAWLAPMVGAETPEGEIARVFANEPANASTPIFGFPPNTRIMSLSLQALPADSPAYIAPEQTRAERLAQERREARAQANGRSREEREQARAEREAERAEQRARQEARARAVDQLVGPGDAATPVRPRAIASLPENSTLLVVRVVGLAYGSGVVLMRPRAEPHTVDYVDAVVPTAWVSGPKEQTIVAIVPPGHWRLSGFSHSSGYITSFCMGAPNFDIAEGEVVFAGSFGFGANGDRLDLNLEPARAALADAPALAGRVRAAEYRNGETFECGAASSFYTYEIAGAPFADDYHYGSRANLMAAAMEAEAVAAEPAPADPASTPAPTEPSQLAPAN